MLNDLTIFVNTHSSAEDCWNMFACQLNKHWPTHPRIVVAKDGPCRSGVGITYIDYSAAKKFSNQYLMGLCAVETTYVLPLQEDFVLYADVDEAAIRSEMPMYHPYSRLIHSGPELYYSMQASIWRADDLKELYAVAKSATPWEAEVEVDRIMQGREMLGKTRCDSHLPMRGRNHRDSPIFPYVSTAIVRGKWNVSEYPDILPALLKQYGIDPAIRGTT